MDERLKRLFQESRDRHKPKEKKPKINKPKERIIKDTSHIYELVSKIEAIKNLNRERFLRSVGKYEGQGEKCAQNENKQAKTHYYDNPLYERFPRDEDLWLTREELENAEQDPNESGRINWEVWDKHIEESRKRYNF